MAKSAQAASAQAGWRWPTANTSSFMRAAWARRRCAAQPSCAPRPCARPACPPPPCARSRAAPPHAAWPGGGAAGALLLRRRLLGRRQVARRHRGFGRMGWLLRGLDQAGALGLAELHLHRLAAPDLLEVVVLADGRLHDVHHRGAAVDDDPLAVFLALGAQHLHAARTHRIAHAGGQGLGLPVAGAGGDDHALEQRRQVLGVEDDDVLGLHVFQPIDDGALQFADVHSAPGSAPVEAVLINIECHRGWHQCGDVQRRRPRAARMSVAEMSIGGSGSATLGAARTRASASAGSPGRCATASVTRCSSSSTAVPGVQVARTGPGR